MSTIETVTDPEIAAIVVKIEAATGPDRELDAQIEALFTDERGNRPLAFFREQIASGHHRPLRFTASIDAAMLLVPDGWLWSVDASGIAVLRQYGTSISGHAASPALAICATALRAHLQGETK